MKYNIILADIANNIICSSFNRVNVGFTTDNIFSTAKYMLATINKPVIGIELNDPINSNYLNSAPVFIDQLPDSYTASCQETVSFTVSARSENSQPLAFIGQVRSSGAWPLITDSSRLTPPTLGIEISPGFYSYTLSINMTNLIPDNIYQVRILAAPVDRWGSGTTKNGNTVWENINTAIKTSPWTSSSVVTINLENCE